MKNVVNLVFKKTRKYNSVNQHSKTLYIQESDISILMPENTHGKEFHIQKNSKLSESIAIGATVGGILGAIAGGILGAMAGMGVGIRAGGMLGGLIEIGFGENEAKQIQRNHENGSVLAAVEIDGIQTSRVKDILEYSNESFAQTSQCHLASVRK